MLVPFCRGAPGRGCRAGCLVFPQGEGRQHDHLAAHRDALDELHVETVSLLVKESGPDLVVGGLLFAVAALVRLGDENAQAVRASRSLVVALCLGLHLAKGLGPVAAYSPWWAAGPSGSD